MNFHLLIKVVLVFKYTNNQRDKEIILHLFYAYLQTFYPGFQVIQTDELWSEYLE
ncbi:hypothetical protein EVA_18259 [gut metagenome]|uniref:Uncharacterized protein n=1 Tax=gut metagenome TaxID=749906 RepID=J9G262_9ZZZZ